MNFMFSPPSNILYIFLANCNSGIFICNFNSEVAIEEGQDKTLTRAHELIMVTTEMWTHNLPILVAR